MERIKHLIEKFWQDEATQHERTELLELLHEHHEEWRKLLENEFKTSQESIQEKALSEAREIELLKKIHARIASQEAIVPPVKRRLWPVVKWVAAVLFLVGSITLYVHQPKDVFDNSVGELADRTGTLEKTNIGAEKMSVVLPDHSVLILSPLSSVVYSTTFGITDREIALTGEANFSVVRDSLRPFIVKANEYTTTALGTEFTISTLEKGKTIVQLIAGKVVVKATEDSAFDIDDVYMKPGDQLLINSRDRQVNLNSPTNQKVSISQDRGIQPLAKPFMAYMRFNKEPLAAVFSRIEEEFDVKILYEDAGQLNLSFTGRFELTDSLEVMLSVICDMNDLTYERDQDRITISKQMINDGEVE